MPKVSPSRADKSFLGSGLNLLTVDALDRYGKALKRLCSSFKNSNTEISECLLRVDSGWVRVEQQLNFLRRVQHLMHDDHLDVYQRTLSVLSGKLAAILQILRGLMKQQSDGEGESFIADCEPKRIKYTFKKDSLDRSIAEFELWQRTADLSWFLLMRIANPQIDAELANGQGPSRTATVIPSTLAIRSGLRAEEPGTSSRSGLSLRPSEIKDMATEEIPRCRAVFATRTSSSGVISKFILDKADSQPLSSNRIVRNDVRDLAHKLRHDDPDTFGLFVCKGFVTESNNSGPEEMVDFTLVFKVPSQYWEDSSPRSLRDLLIGSPAPVSELPA
ncbi:hypothetical protein jhhlp_004173 [Lomentospora prolificans]|uniref:Uncharacterized protein n=1 Tax=Lomentospora prolificans TaxID=41688 RepID=A0A2N3NAT2_9PEZI|nr:hypothetical protein jhhlp_004173 [Lomentospora prolificans]